MSHGATIIVEGEPREFVPLFVEKKVITGDHRQRDVARLLREAMACTPFNMDWPIELPEPPERWSASTLTTVHYLNEKSLSNGGVWVKLYNKLDDEETRHVYGYANAFTLDEEAIDAFGLATEGFTLKARPGDLLWSFAGLDPQLHGGRYDPATMQFITPPPGGWNGTKRPGVGLYRKLCNRRMAACLSPGQRVFVRTHPDCDTVVNMAKSFGFNIVGRLEVLQAGRPQPKVVLGRET